MKNGIYSTKESYPDNFVKVAAVVNDVVANSWGFQVGGNGAVSSARVGEPLPSNYNEYRPFTADERKQYELSK